MRGKLPLSLLGIFFVAFPPGPRLCTLLMPGGGGGALPYKRLMGMCRWMGSHFHDWTDYNGVAFSKELLEWGRTFSDFWGRELFIFTVSKRTRIFVQ